MPISLLILTINNKCSTINIVKVNKTLLFNKEFNMTSGTLRKDIINYVASQYGTEPEYPWFDLPEHAVLRHSNGKWYGIIMNIPKVRLGLKSTENIDILVCKCDPMMRDLLLSEKGFYPAYHMNKTHWITVLLDGSVNTDLVFHILDLSHQIISNRNKKTRKNI